MCMGRVGKQLGQARMASKGSVKQAEVVPGKGLAAAGPDVGEGSGASSDAASGPAEICLEVRSNPLYLSAARELVAAATRRLGFLEEASSQIALAVDEALCNVIRHGYDRDPHRPIWISLFPEGNGWGNGLGNRSGNGGDGVVPGSVETRFPTLMRIVIEDEAKQVDPAEIKSRDLEEVRPGGLGVHIIKSVMDEVRYERREPIGMRLTMVKIRRESVEGVENDSTSTNKPATAPMVGRNDGRACGGGGVHG